MVIAEKIDHINCLGEPLIAFVQGKRAFLAIGDLFELMIGS
ncbi:hypothetical protein AF72_10455 [Xylella taiwanensis]|uniref:Uncharacterized protein n=1 Tax=Xylella taiwanensis TaxID=1444770 RepID=Z9JH86_9GAMM|nr:hypothetical protein AF72_10455 [Xylella taiwanensis]